MSPDPPPQSLPDPPAERRRRRWLLGLLIVGATFAAYYPALRAGYVWDDDQYLTDNPLVKLPGGLPEIWRIRVDRAAGRLRINTPQYYPLVYSSYWLEYRLWGDNPLGYHAVNVGLHAIAALLVWLVASRLGLPLPWLIAAVFALHPVHVESVAWITERKNVLSGVFYLAAMATLVSFFGLSDGIGRRAWWQYAPGLLFFLAALLSKTVTCSLPAVLLLLFAYRRRRPRLADWAALLPLFAIGLAAGLLTAYLERTHVGASGDQWNYTLLERSLLVAPRAFVFYATKIVWPHPLIFIYPRWEPAWDDPLCWAAVGTTVLAGLILVSGRRRWGDGPWIALAFSAVTLAPALGFFKVYPHRFSWVADHFQYLGSLGFIALAVAIVAAAARRLSRGLLARGLLRVSAVVLLATLGMLGYRHARSFESAERLWHDTLAANPDAWIASLNLGIIASQNGDYREAAEWFEYTARYPEARAEALESWGTALLRLKRLDGAIQKLREAVDARPNWSKAHGKLGAALALAGRRDEAIAELELATRLEPDWLMPLLNLAQLYTHPPHEDYAAAEYCLRQALEIAPLATEPRRLYADLLLRRGEACAALQQLDSLLRLRPDAYAQDALYAAALFDCGEDRQALRLCESLLAEDPTDRDAALVLARLRATSPIAELRDGLKAVQMARRLARQRPRDPAVKDVLACAYAELGEFDRAVATAREALTLARDREDDELAELIRRHLECFEKGEPWRRTAPHVQ